MSEEKESERVLTCEHGERREKEGEREIEKGTLEVGKERKERRY